MSLISPAPRGFCPSAGAAWAQLSDTPPSFATRPRRRTGRRLQGVKYENQVQKMLLATYPHLYVPSPWIQFSCHGKIKWCQPDGLILDATGGNLTIVEIKYQHTSDSWWQMRKLYEPVLELIFPRHLWRYSTLELVKWYDPVIAYPEPIRLLAKPTEARNLPLNTTGIHIWKP